MHTTSSISLRSETDICSESQFEEVKKFIRTFELDNRELKQTEFLVEQKGPELLGFGRIREYNGFSELCSLGVIEHQRLKGIGKKLCQALIKKTNQPLYLVCIIPEYFSSFGFTICNEYPAEIKNKLDYCIGSLPVEETYVVMKLS